MCVSQVYELAVSDCLSGLCTVYTLTCTAVNGDTCTDTRVYMTKVCGMSVYIIAAVYWTWLGAGVNTITHTVSFVSGEGVA